MQATSHRIPAGIVLVSVALMAWMSFRPFGQRPVIDGSFARTCIESSPSTSEVAHAMGDAIRPGSLLGVIDTDGAPPGGTPPSAPPPAVTQIAPCTEPLRLVATAAAPAPSRANDGASATAMSGARGLAVIADGGARAELVRIGAPVGARTLVAIGARDVVLADEAGRSCSVAMSSRPANDQRATPPTPVLHRPVGERRVRQGAPADGVPRRGALRSALGRVRVLPHVENGRTVGVRMIGVRTSAVLGALGFEDGDVVRTVNGYSIATPDEALRAYTALRDTTRLTVSLERNGAPLTIDFNVF